MARGKASGGGPRTAARKDEEERVCPLCIEPLDETEQEFYPCSCGYQVCLFCFEKLKDTCNNLCPGCRAEYGTDQEVYAKRSAPRKNSSSARGIESKSSAERANSNGSSTTGQSSSTRAASSLRTPSANHAPPPPPAQHASTSAPSVGGIASAPSGDRSLGTGFGSNQDAGGGGPEAARQAGKASSGVPAVRSVPQDSLVPPPHGSDPPLRGSSRELSLAAMANKLAPSASASPRLAPQVPTGGAGSASSSSAWPRLSDAAIAAALPVRQQSLREASSGSPGDSAPAASRPTSGAAAPSAPASVVPVPTKPLAKGTPAPTDTPKGIGQHDPKVLPLANGGFKAANPAQLYKPVPTGPAVPEALPHVQAPVEPTPRPAWLQDLMYESRWVSNADPQACLFVDEVQKAVRQGTLSSRDAAMKLLEYLHHRAVSQGMPFVFLRKQPGALARGREQGEGTAGCPRTGPQALGGRQHYRGSCAPSHGPTLWETAYQNPSSQLQQAWAFQSMWGQGSEGADANGSWPGWMHSGPAIPPSGHAVLQPNQQTQAAQQGSAASLFASLLGQPLL
eukprot:jgi/Botrbrau1/16334/Bobra.0066s0100.1